MIGTLRDNIKIWYESWRFNISIKINRRQDVFGKSYRYCYKKYGHKTMMNEYLGENSWKIK